MVRTLQKTRNSGNAKNLAKKLTVKQKLGKIWRYLVSVVPGNINKINPQRENVLL